MELRLVRLCLFRTSEPLFFFLLSFCLCNCVSDKATERFSDFGPVAEYEYDFGVKPYTTSSKFPQLLQKCLGETLYLSCKSIPLIGQEFENPSLDDLMSRVLVSSDQQGRKLIDFMTRLPKEVRDDLLALSKTIRGLVISGKTGGRRGGFNNLSNRSIILNPSLFEISNDETPKTDAFSKKRNPLPTLISTNGTDVKNKIPIYDGESGSNIELKKDNAAYEFARVMYHELAHAADYSSPNKTDVDSSTDFYITKKATEQGFIKENSYLDTYVVSFIAKDEKFDASDYTTQKIADSFAKDLSLTFYAYMPFEDVAVTFEKFMILYRLGIDSFVIVADNANGGDAQQPTPIFFGQKNRILSGKILGKAKFIASLVYPEMASTFSKLKFPIETNNLERGQTLEWNIQNK